MPQRVHGNLQVTHVNGQRIPCTPMIWQLASCVCKRSLLEHCADTSAKRRFLSIRHCIRHSDHPDHSLQIKGALYRFTCGMYVRTRVSVLQEQKLQPSDMRFYHSHSGSTSSTVCTTLTMFFTDSYQPHI